jgi:two-component system chemotaxis response regulator CheB
LAQQSERLETALWVALRALEEKADLARKMASRARMRGHEQSAKQFDRQSQDAVLRAESIRAVLFTEQPAAADAATSGAE